MDITWKVLSAGVGLVAGVAANKLVDLAWVGFTGKESPEDEEFTRPFREVLVFSVVSATVGAIVQEVTMRKTARWYGAKRVAKKARFAEKQTQ